ncbi:metal-sensitive transcriptional regulator [Alicyclobacillus ferrooxydans]|uniref:Transcriptional regulator n=1 Tax=Alicyclobacillus ferrooxydans TaxID=471514 RepID=A0A0P9GRV7_9BACL|nr:metal-sensitive transcriptional regulator [Alicyclobacillus ferrooxydans]KPV43770.1 transcriptional regulator [Alicyclobacillus ferrooxydans]
MCADHIGHSYGPKKDDLLKRLRRVEGQVRGIQKMIDEDRYCVDILVQIAAIKSAMQQVGLTILESHTRGCVVDAISNHTDTDIKIDELMEVIRQFTKP